MDLSLHKEGSQYHRAVAGGSLISLIRESDTASMQRTMSNVSLTLLPILIMWNDTDTPLAYFMSFRTYGTWLHGDKRGSTDRFHNQYGAPFIEPNEKWRVHNEKQLKRNR